MSYFATVINVMIASPGDVQKEREIIQDVIHKWNAANTKTLKLVLMPITWELSAFPEMGDRAQAILNKQLGDCDLLVAVFHSRLGTPTGNSQSGTVEEINRHIQAKKAVMIYFSGADIPPEHIESDQWTALQEFKKTCQKRGLYNEYRSIEDFRGIFSHQLTQQINSNFLHLAPKESKGLSQVIEDPTPQLSDEAYTLIIATANSTNGQFLRKPHINRNIIMTTDRGLIVETKDHRETAQWDAAIEELESRDLIRAQSDKRVAFKITDKGNKFVGKLNNKQQPQLSNEARSLLVEAAQDPQGKITFTHDMREGTQIKTNNKDFIKTGDSRDKAKWTAALEELLESKLIEDAGGKGEVFRLTNAGYNLANQLIQDNNLLSQSGKKQEPQLSDGARILLIEASNDTHGIIQCNERDGIAIVDTNNKLLTDTKNQKSAVQSSAKLQVSINELLKLGLIEIYFNDKNVKTYRVTSAGYELADKLAKNNEAEAGQAK